jgi:uncharacterized DUF497 family protein
LYYGNERNIEVHYEYDPEKAIKNKEKHKVDFEEAITVFKDPKLIIKADIEHSIEEERFIALGYSKKERCLFVVFCEFKDEWSEVARIISARCANGREEKIYRSANER